MKKKIFRELARKFSEFFLEKKMPLSMVDNKIAGRKIHNSEAAFEVAGLKNIRGFIILQGHPKNEWFNFYIAWSTLGTLPDCSEGTIFDEPNEGEFLFKLNCLTGKDEENNFGWYDLTPELSSKIPKKPNDFLDFLNKIDVPDDTAIGRIDSFLNSITYLIHKHAITYLRSKDNITKPSN